MFSQNAYNGASLPPNTLCLTYDDGPGETDGDGPGPHSLELAQFLSDQGIRATFFNIGQHASQYPDIVEQIHDLGHLIGNHTLGHASLPDFLSGGGDVFTEVGYADEYIRMFVDGPIVYFRPPYGNWTPGVATALNQRLVICRDHVGPILWDIDGTDWQFWQNGQSVEECCQHYLDLINQAKKGIVLMHDSNWDDNIRPKLNTYALTQMLVPKLQEQGYQFVRVDEIPDVQAAAAANLNISLQGFNGDYVSVQDAASGRTAMSADPDPTSETFTVENLGYDTIALRAGSGLYVSPQDGGADGAEVLTNGPSIGDWEPLKIINLGEGRIAFQTVNGYYLSVENLEGGRLMASSPWIRQREIFTFTIQ